MSNISYLTTNDKFGTWFNKINAIIEYINFFSVDKDKIPPLNHASEETTYGVGDNTKYGHVMLSDEIDDEYKTTHGIASTPYATKKAYDKALEAITVAENSLSTSNINSETLEELKAELKEISGEIINHASEKETYGIGTKSLYGHLKLSDAIDNVSNENSGVAATPKAVKTTYDLATRAFNLSTTNETELINKAPTKHSSSENIYGGANKDEYGHVKIIDTISNDDATKSITVSPKAIKSLESSLWNEINNTKSTLDDVVNNKAQKNHATATGTNIGIATGGMYGHILLSDNINADKDISSGTAVTPKALSLVDEKVTKINATVNTLSNDINDISTLLDNGNGSTTKYLRGDGTWATPTNTTYSAGTGISLSGTTFSLSKYGSANNYGEEESKTLKFGNTINIPYIKTDEYGRVIAFNTAITLPNTTMTGANDTTNGTSGLVPAPSSGNQEKFLRGDGTWASPNITTVVPEMIGAIANNKDGTSGLVPAPTKDDTRNFLCGDGTWSSPKTMIGATEEEDGHKGLVPAPGMEHIKKFLRGDGTWATPTNTTYSVMTGATSTAAGKAGLVPAPSTGNQNDFLKGDGSWATPYTLPTATSTRLGGVKVGSNITNSSGTISLTKSNVTTALGYTPVASVNNTSIDANGNVAITSVETATKWNGSTKTVSTAAASGGANGDIWFQYI